MTRARTFIACVAAGSALLLASVLVYMYVASRATAESQFGFYYGRHPFDGTPAISHANQIARTIDILLAALGHADRAPDAS